MNSIEPRSNVVTAFQNSVNSVRSLTEAVQAAPDKSALYHSGWLVSSGHAISGLNNLAVRLTAQQPDQVGSAQTLLDHADILTATIDQSVGKFAIDQTIGKAAEGEEQFAPYEREGIVGGLNQVRDDLLKGVAALQ